MNTRGDVIRAIAQASIQGNLGYFVGSGVSMALTAGTLRPAPNWVGLLREVEADLNASLAQLGLARVALPEPAAAYGQSAAALATGLCRRFAESLMGCPKYGGRAPAEVEAEAELMFRFAVARLCAFSPRPDYRDAVAAAFKSAPPSWFVTTNYDLLLEELLPNSVSLFPQEPLRPGPGAIPVFHLHGHRRDPSSIVIFEDDYQGILVREDYRQARLAVAFSESVTVMLGYSIGDINVQLALESARTFRRQGPTLGAGSVIQAYHVPGVVSGPVERKGLVELPIADIAAFLQEVAGVRGELTAAAEDLDRRWEEFYQKAGAAFLRDSEHRRRALPLLVSRSRNGADRVVKWLEDVMAPVFDLARADGGFSHYDEVLAVVLDLMCAPGFEGAHPALIAWAYAWFTRVAMMISREPGTKTIGDSWAATRTWHTRKAEMPPRVLEDLKARAQRLEDPWVLRLV